MLPIAWRGIWIDNFALFGLPCLIWMVVVAFRERNVLHIALLGIGFYNLLFYAAVSLDIERYQLTALPSVAIAVALAAGRLLVSRRRPEPASA
jgi:hypothetical protein